MHLTQDLKIKETLTALKWKRKRLNANKGAKIIFNVSCQIVNKKNVILQDLVCQISF